MEKGSKNESNRVACLGSVSVHINIMFLILPSESSLMYIAIISMKERRSPVVSGLVHGTQGPSSISVRALEFLYPNTLSYVAETIWSFRLFQLQS